MEFTDWPVFLLGAVAVFLGSTLQASTGIGLGMVAAPILLMIDPVLVPGPILVLALLVSILIARREWSDIDKSGLAVALGGRVPGSILAGLTMTLLPLEFYSIVFGVMVILAVALSSLGLKVMPTRTNLLTAGFASGYMGTLTSIGAPPMAIAYQHGSPPTIRSTMAAYFVIGTAVSIVILAFYGRFGIEQIVASIVFVPPLILGYWTSGHVVRRLDRELVRRSVLALSGISGLILIVRSLPAIATGQ
ncbi:MAG: sulfite exporter TauE/SafE family protein [Woeseiaceae bacterium]